MPDYRAIGNFEKALLQVFNTPEKVAQLYRALSAQFREMVHIQDLPKATIVALVKIAKKDTRFMNELAKNARLISSYGNGQPDKTLQLAIRPLINPLDKQIWREDEVNELACKLDKIYGNLNVGVLNFSDYQSAIFVDDIESWAAANHLPGAANGFLGAFEGNEEQKLRLSQAIVLFGVALARNGDYRYINHLVSLVDY